MKYISQYLWEKGSAEQVNPVSVVLQQAKIRGKSVLLACVCEGGSTGEAGVTESGYFTEKLVEWFYHVFLKKYRKGNTHGEVQAALEAEFEKISGELMTYGKKKNFALQLQYGGILLKDNEFWLFFQGNSNGYLLNRRFNKRHIRNLHTTQQTMLVSGKIQRKLGVLLCTAGFEEYIEKEELLETLFVEKEFTEEKSKKRLKEIWQENVRRGGIRGAGAVYIWIS